MVRFISNEIRQLLPSLTYSLLIEEANSIDPIDQEFLFCNYYELTSIEERNLNDIVIYKVLRQDSGFNDFCSFLMNIVTKHSHK